MSAMTLYQWLGLVVLVGWIGALVAYGYRTNAALTKTMLLGTLAGVLCAVPMMLGFALLLGDLP